MVTVTCPDCGLEVELFNVPEDTEPRLSHPSDSLKRLGERAAEVWGHNPLEPYEDWIIFW